MNSVTHLGNIVLSGLHSEIYQNIYASQNYDVFFGVFGRFEYSKVKHRITALDLELINYKGDLNMEFVDYELYIEEEEPQEQNSHSDMQRVIILNLHVKAATNSTPNLTMEICKDDLESIYCHQNDVFIVAKSLRALNGDTQEEFDERVGEELANDEQPVIQPYVNGIFDSEFYYKNGSILEKRAVNDNTLKSKGGGNIKFIDQFEINTSITDGSPSCRQRISIITIL